ncbi:MAG: class I SAM-dependent methyltransferase [Caldilinea sp. CFX5]|nr:class I SAM-dependent methyltransferase [Caldilinea sp. CFX5]
MTAVNTEYTGMMAQFWDLLRGDSSHWTDRFFYKEVVTQSGQPALDVGCGTGRLVLDFLAEGIDIDGVDNSPEMLDYCRQKGAKLGLPPTLYLQSMTALALPRRYQTILVPSGSIQILIEPNDVRAAMQRFFAHLLPGGTLVVSFYQLWTGGPVGPTAREEWMREVVRPEDGAVLRRWSRSTYDLVNNLEHTEHRYDLIRNGEVVVSQRFARSPATRGYTQAQAQQIFVEAGFANVRVTSAFTHEPAQADDTLFSVWGTKPKM